MAPAGGTDRYFRMRSPQNAACAHPMGLKVAARTAFANAGSMWAAGWPAQRMEREPGSIQAKVC